MSGQGVIFLPRIACPTLKKYYPELVLSMQLYSRKRERERERDCIESGLAMNDRSFEYYGEAAYPPPPSNMPARFFEDGVWLFHSAAIRYDYYGRKSILA